MAITLQSDGKILIGGEFTSFNGIISNGAARLNSDGTIDASFVQGIEAGSMIQTIALQSDQKIVVGGTGMGTEFRNIARLNTDGSLDPSFHRGIIEIVQVFSQPGISGILYNILIQPDGKILIGGIFNAYDITHNGTIVRLNADGTFDTGFSPVQTAIGTRGLFSNVYATALESSGKVILGGTFNTFFGASGIIRFNPDGGFDNSFDAGTGLFFKCFFNIK